MSRGRVRIVVLLFPAMVVSVAPAAEPARGRAYRLRNDTSDRRLTVYRVDRTLRRGSAGGRDQVSYVQVSEWTRLQLAQGERSPARLVQLVSDQAADSHRARGSSDDADDPPMLSVSAGSARIATDEWSARDAPVALPLVDAAQQAALAALLDFAHWPDGARRLGDRWENPLGANGFDGTQTFTLRDAERRDGRTLLTIELSAAGRFVGEATSGGATFDTAEARIVWHFGRNTLDSLSGRAAWHVGEGASRQHFELLVEARMVRHDVLSIDAANEHIDQLNELGEAIRLRRVGRTVDARAACQAYLDKWPRSLWRPALDHLMGEIDPSRHPSLVEAEFRMQLASMLKDWRSAQDGGDRDAIERARAALQQAARGDRDRLLNLIEHPGESTRSAAVFVLSFGNDDGDVDVLQRCTRDASPKVRVWALYGLAARRSPRTDPAVLLAALSDEDAAVRARACETVTSCVPRDSATLPMLKDRILTILREDGRDSTRLAAAAAMEVLATADDAPRLRRSLKAEPNRAVRVRIERTLKRVEPPSAGHPPR